ncbi:hypothetical protein QLQ15_17760 [Lysobacter sp. LF1]|uniref:Phage holin family protein n=1 Tax=Lysobacter stagni TaxID=3045172 RepID=A0ABT6XLD5_9GAMM|nr:hypothetical protein [Lysobacter sp. LF1]MDI9240753.1 hypothetical protein [Lysobacter sp. LF1]
MKAETGGLVGQAMAAFGVAATAHGLTWWAIASALIGAAASFYFEPEQLPDKALKLLGGILAIAFCAVLLSIAVPHVPLFGWTENVPIAVRAGLLGVSVRFLIEQGKRIGRNWKPSGG